MLSKEDLQQMLMEKQKEVDEIKKSLQNLNEKDDDDSEPGPDNLHKMEEKEMVQWSTNDVAHWFQSLGIKNVIDRIIEFQVDGLLLLNMQKPELLELGITSSIQLQKLEIKLRYYRQKHLSKYDPDSLLPISNDSVFLSIATPMDNENLSSMLSILDDDDDDHDNSDKESNEIQIEDYFSKQIICFGDENGNQPKDGDIIEIHYVVQIKDERTNNIKLIECSRSSNSTSTSGGPFEFVLGIGQAIQGLEEAIKCMSRGERSTIIIPFMYGYGEEGIPPAIPPKSNLICDVELLNFRGRPRWIKPWIQSLGLCQKPYYAKQADDTIQI